MIRFNPMNLFVAIAGCCAIASGSPGMCQAGQTVDPKNVTELMASLGRAVAELKDYTVTGVTEKAGKSEQFKLTFKQPNLIRIDTPGGQVAVQPNGEIKGRMGHGAFGHISRKLKRSDRRLLDSEGIPFFESDFGSMVARMQAQIKAGATASLTTQPDTYILEIRSGKTSWRYTVDHSSFIIRENSRTVDGKQVEITRYSDFHPNGGVKEDLFRF
jgi:outer membrane lipoprotein-sorting protein